MNDKVSTKRSKSLKVLAGVVLCSVLLVALNAEFKWLTTSLVSVPAHAPFDGTTYPLKQAPIWTKLTTAEYKQDFSSFSSSKLMSLPFYNPDDLVRSTDSLVWGNSDHDAIRNAKITYSTPYMGNYRLDGKEYGGSHLAVDIKVPTGTPVYAIANGTVIKVSNQTSGFGHHIVIQHNNVPTLENKNAKTVLYSSYSHLSETLVKEGDVLRKGDKIALTGSSGTATTPHLHFQIDNSEAPWHPFWPFTNQEAYNEGLDFFSAVNAGLGKELAMKTTINPMLYVQKYLDPNTVPEDNGGNTNSGNNNSNNNNNSGGNSGSGTNADSYVDDSNNNSSSEDNQSDMNVPKELSFKFETRREYYVGKDAPFKVFMRDQFDNVYQEGFNGEVIVKTEKSLGTSKNSIVNAMQFSNGELSTGLKNLQPGRDRLMVEYEGKKYYSDYFNVSGESASDDLKFYDVPKSHPNYEAIMYLADQGIISGHPDGSFKPNDTVNRAEALKFIFAGQSELMDSQGLPFTDTNNEAWYADYLYTAYMKGVVSGHPDGSFKPSSTVNKAEFLKMLFNGMEVEVPSSLDDKPYSDVRTTDWFAGYFAKAKERNVIDRELRFVYPSTGMTRGDVAQGIYNLMKN